MDHVCGRHQPSTYTRVDRYSKTTVMGKGEMSCVDAGRRLRVRTGEIRDIAQFKEMKSSRELPFKKWDPMMYIRSAGLLLEISDRERFGGVARVPGKDERIKTA